MNEKIKEIWMDFSRLTGVNKTTSRSLTVPNFKIPAVKSILM